MSYLDVSSRLSGSPRAGLSASGSLAWTSSAGAEGSCAVTTFVVSILLRTVVVFDVVVTSSDDEEVHGGGGGGFLMVVLSNDSVLFLGHQNSKTVLDTSYMTFYNYKKVNIKSVNKWPLRDPTTWQILLIN